MIQWHDFGGSMQSHCGRFEIDEIGPGHWQPEDNILDEPGPATDLEAAKGWCEMRVQTEQVMPDVLIETIDGQTIVLPATEAPEF